MRWIDYKLEVKITPRTTTGAISVLFRYQDAKNFYRHVLGGDLAVQSKLLKYTNGKQEVLEVGNEKNSPAILEAGNAIVIEIIVVGHRIMIKESGLLVVDYFDKSTTPLLQGGIGLSCSNHANVEYDNIILSRPADFIVVPTSPKKVTDSTGQVQAKVQLATWFIPKPKITPYGWWSVYDVFFP